MSNEKQEKKAAGQRKQADTHRKKVMEKSANTLRKHFDGTVERMTVGVAQTMSMVMLEMRKEIIKIMASWIQPILEEQRRAGNREDEIGGLLEMGESVLGTHGEAITKNESLITKLVKEIGRAQKEEERMSGLIQCLIQVDKIALEKIEENREMITKSARASAGALEELREIFMTIQIDHLEKEVRRSYFQIALDMSFAVVLIVFFLNQAGLV